MHVLTGIAAVTQRTHQHPAIERTSPSMCLPSRLLQSTLNAEGLLAFAFDWYLGALPAETPKTKFS